MQNARPQTDPMAPLDISDQCDGRRTDFPLGMDVDTVKVMLNDVYLEEGLDFLLGHKHGQAQIELRRPPPPGSRLVVLRVPAREPFHAPHEQRSQEIDDVPPYEQLPKRVKDNISREQWTQARRAVIHEGERIPETTSYINLKNGLVFAYTMGERATGPLLPEHDLAGGRGRDDTQFHTAPRGAHGVR